MTNVNILTLEKKELKNITTVINFFIMVIILQACKGVGGPSSRENIIINDGLPSGAKGFPAGVDDTPDGNSDESLTVVVDTPDGNSDESPTVVVDTPDGNSDESPTVVVDTPDGNSDESPTVVVVDTPDGNSDESPTVVVVDTPDGNLDESPTVVVVDTPDGNLDDTVEIDSQQSSQAILLPGPPAKTLKQQQLETIKYVEKVVFNMIATMTLNDIPGEHQDDMEAVALALRTHTIKNPNFVDIIAREGGDDIIASPNNNLFIFLNAIDLIPDPLVKERVINTLKDDLSGDIILVSAGNTGKELEHSVLKKAWVKELLEEEDINVFFVIGTITNKDGETSIADISSTLPRSLADNVIGAPIRFPILKGDEVEIPGGTSTAAVLTGTFFARLQVLLPEATLDELVEIGKWLLKPLENSNSLGVISFEKFTQIKEYFCKPLHSISLEEILTYIQSNPKDPTLNEEGLSGAQELFPEPIIDDVYIEDLPPLVVEL